MSSASSTAIISAADQGYFHHLLGLILSIHEHAPLHAQNLCVIDLGMLPAQLDQLRPLVGHIVPGRWDFEFPAQHQTPRTRQSMTAKPFHRDYFPGFQSYAWIDADAWFQDGRAMELLLGDLSVDIAIAPEIHWAYSYMYDPGKMRDFGRACVAESFGENAARHLEFRATFNSGFYSMRADSPLWDRFRTFLEFGYRRHVNHLTEQIALNLAIYSEQTSPRPLPAWCNWLCVYALPRFDPRRKCLCESTVPFDKLSMIHLAGANRPGVKVLTPDNQSVEVPLDALGFRQFCRSEAPANQSRAS